MLAHGTLKDLGALRLFVAPRIFKKHLFLQLLLRILCFLFFLFLFLFVQWGAYLVIPLSLTHNSLSVDIPPKQSNIWPLSLRATR